MTVLLSLVTCPACLVPSALTTLPWAALGRAVQGAFHLRTCWMRGREIVAGGAAVPARMSGQAWKWKLPVCSGTRLEASVRGRAGEGERIVWPAHGAQGLS